MRLWVAQMVLNFAWSPMFFGAEQILGAFIVILALLIAILLFIRASWHQDRLSAGLFLPYAAWVAFASLLNDRSWPSIEGRDADGLAFACFGAAGMRLFPGAPQHPAGRRRIRRQKLTRPMTEHAPADFRGRIQRSFARQAAMRTIGAELTQVNQGTVEIELPFDEKLTQQHGFLHAGVISAALDCAGTYAAYSLIDPDASILTIEFKVNLMSPGRGERFLFRGE